MSQESIEHILIENRIFYPSDDFKSKAKISSSRAYEELYNQAALDISAFWAKHALQDLHWFKPFQKSLEQNIERSYEVQWFADGLTNASYNCLDLQIAKGLGSKLALLWESEQGEIRRLTYQDLLEQVELFSGVLMELGVSRGDVVSIYMPMTPEAVISMLACARIGAIHSVIFAGFSADSIAERNNNARAKLAITADGFYRRGKIVPTKSTMDEALLQSPTIQKCIVLKRLDLDVSFQNGRDFWWHELMSRQKQRQSALPLPSENPLFILYTSGSTGKPKGIVHTTAGYQLYAKRTFDWVFDYRSEDLFWCTADCGWITGHSYVVYGPLANGASVFIYEGAPNFPDEGRFWKMIERHRIQILYTAPTAIRSFIKAGDRFVHGVDLSSLRLLGTVGEGINPEAWMWYHRKIGAEKCPIVDTWWQTETGGIMMSPLPGAIPTKPGSCTKPLPGIFPVVLDQNLKSVDVNQGGMLCISKPWPGMLRGVWGDQKRFYEQYWQRVPGMYLTGDNARSDEDQYYWIMGRIDDVINVAGHRLSTIEIESSLVSHPFVAEAAAVGRQDDIKGQAIVVFIVTKAGASIESLEEVLKRHVRKEIGALAVPDEIRLVSTLPKTRSGKIMRRLLRAIAEGRSTEDQDTSTLDN